MKNTTRVAYLIAIALLTGCSASRPILYNNEAYKKAPDKAELAVDDCIASAKEAGAKGKSKLEDSAYRAAAGGTASAAAGGAAAAAGGGRYDVGGSMKMSAAAGSAGNFVLGMFDDDVDPVFARYVETCLAEKGFKTIGWK